MTLDDNLQPDALEQDARVDEVPRMATDTRELSGPERHRAIINIKRLREQFGLSLKRLADMAGVTDSVVSEVLRNRYQGKTDEILVKLEGALNEHARRQAAGANVKYVHIATARQIFKVVKYVSKAESIGVITGVSGIGKSMALEAITRSDDFRTAILVSVAADSKSPLRFARALLRAIAGNRASAIESVWSVADAFAEICDRLGSGQRLILIDEAENLQLETLNLIRQIHDRSQSPIVLCGRPHLSTKIERTTKCEEIGGSLVGRICFRHQLSPPRGLAPGLPGGADAGEWICDKIELAQILSGHKIRFRPDAIAWLHDLAHLSALRQDTGRESGGLRLVAKLAMLAVAVNRGEASITAEMCQRAYGLMVGPTEARALADLVAQYRKRQSRATDTAATA